MKLPALTAKNVAFGLAGVALLIVAWRHADAALAVATGALAIIGAVAGLNLSGG